MSLSRLPSALAHPSRRTIFFAAVAACIVVGAILFRPSASDGSVPYVPTSNDVVLEHVPPASSPRARLLINTQQHLAQNPQNLPLALELAQMYIEESRKTGDPRNLGYAQAALTPWWDLSDPPPPVLLLRATIRQSVHDFDSALVDLDRLLVLQPQNVQARLTRATVHIVRAEYDAARSDCALLAHRPIIWTVCTASIQAVTGQAEAARKALSDLLKTSMQPEERQWVDSVLAETDERLGLVPESAFIFDLTVKADPTDTYARTAYADLLLDMGQPEKAADLVRDQITNDAMLLRLALAEAAMSATNPSVAKDAEKHRAMLQARFAASHERGDVVHRREEARFELGLNHDAEKALALARANFDVQKEPWDVRIYLEAAKAAKNIAAAKTVIDFVKTNKLQDPKIDALAAELDH